MAERVSGPYRGYYISAAARLVPAVDTPAPSATLAGGASGTYVGSVSLAEHGPDDPHRMETLLELGDGQRFGSEEEALVFVEQAARDYVDRLLGGS
ncbi:hypothetical protein DR64_192 [Paraburkholderia xenovorans LB400]|jgi:hypothetical protein|uniref:Uncharacterized protein n=1 Tax=Paraburkholderia xenovorans (strain LB400) TaxID=266265 RepID=Q13ZL5_PARXL|nr:hypothetical protein [Paraburkholderia xenovorans]ABE30474.1 hypothetical protein Bxe_A2499 [Paraburkholderia xenovorans LB400]AIP29560.1 hypothetical protein DR64_192 [Paraburkholderia xenovorans LB400]NPT35439.1 hypothetical protein [Paraburkholderia xenovorans]